MPHLANQPFSATPNAGYKIDKWYVDDQLYQTGGSTFTLNNIAQDHTVKVTFVKVWSLTASAGTGGSITPAGTFRVRDGADQPFTATPNADYKVDGWYVDTVLKQTGGNDFTLNNIGQDHTVRVTFVELHYITPVAQPPEGGTITPSSRFRVRDMADYTFTAAPNAGYEVDGWYVDVNGQDTLFKTGGTSFTLNNIQEDHRVTVTFKGTATRPVLTAWAEPAGAGTVSPSGTFSVAYLTDQRFTATPNTGYAVDGWYVGYPDGEKRITAWDGDAVVTLNNIGENHTVRVVFTSTTGSSAVRTANTAPYYIPGAPTLVAIAVMPAAGTTSYRVADVAPAGWSVTGIDAGGTYDGGTRTVSWGPFADAQARTLHYTLTPPLSATGDAALSGTATFSGTGQPIQPAPLTLTAALTHPADQDNNWQMRIGEMTAYGDAWKTGTAWTRPPTPVPADYATNAAALWQAGEVYHFTSGTAPGCWVAGTRARGTSPRSISTGRAMAQASPVTIGREQGWRVTITVTPPADCLAYAVEEQPASRWRVTDVDEEGCVDPVSGMVRWGLFLDGQPRVVHYTILAIRPQLLQPEAFTGLASFDGRSMPIVRDGGTESAGVSGDVNGDGVRTLADLDVLLDALLGAVALTTAQARAADLDGNGMVTMADAIRWRQLQ